VYLYKAVNALASADGSSAIWSRRGLERIPKPTVIPDAIEIRILFGQASIFRIKGNCLL